MGLEIPPRVFWGSLVVVLGLGFGVYANPYITTASAMYTVVVNLLLAVTAGVCFYGVFFAYRRDSHRLEVLRNPRLGAPAWSGWASLAVIVALALFMHRARWMHPSLFFDDFHYLEDSADWETTREHLFTPYNEHVVVSTRLITYAVIRLSDESNREMVMALCAIPLFGGALIQLFLLARRRWSSDAAGLLAVALFGLSNCYREIVHWYAASMWLAPFNMLLLGLNLAEGADGSNAKRRLTALGLLCFAAPYSYSLGLFVGPTATAWLLTGDPYWRTCRRWILALIPAAAGVLGGLSVLPIILSFVGSAAQIRAKNPRAFGNANILEGGVYAAQMTLDMLLLRNVGVRFPLDDRWLYACGFALIPLGLLVLFRARPAAWRIAPMIILWAMPYALSMPIRTWVNYHDLTKWSRYQLVPYLGCSLFLLEMLRQFRPNWLATPDGRPTRKQIALLLGLAVFLVWLHDVSVPG